MLPPRKNGRGSPRKRAATAEQEDEIEEEDAEVVRSPVKKRKVERQVREPTAESEPAAEEDIEVESLLRSSPGKKRELEEAEEEEEADEEQEEEEEEVARAGSSSRPPDSQASQVSLSDIKKAKKRARR